MTIAADDQKIDADSRRQPSPAAAGREVRRSWFRLDLSVLALVVPALGAYSGGVRG